ncbi:MAG: dynamin family protein [Cycloclasticus sp.]|jgi:Dynamin family.
MMNALSIQQRNYLDMLAVLTDINTEFDVNQQVGKDLAYLSEKINGFKILVPVIGKFSSGKSTLLKSYLSIDLLKEDITPETAFATELHYSEQERMVVHYLDGSEPKVFTVEDFKTLQGNDNLYFVQLYLNNTKLKRHQRLVLVDMPGFDSKNSAHHKAIACYLNRGDVFINLLPAGIPFDSSIMDQMAEIKLGFNKDIKCFVSKSARLTETKLQESIGELEQTLSGTLGAPTKVGHLESLDKTRTNLGGFETELTLIETRHEELLDNRYGLEIDKLIGKLTAELTNLKTYSQSNQGELEQQKQDANNSFRDARTQLERSLNELKYSLCSQGKEQLIQQVHMALNGALMQLTNAAKSDNLNSCINQILRPVVQSGLTMLVDKEVAKLESSLAQISVSDFQGPQISIALNTEQKEKMKALGGVIITQLANFILTKTGPIGMTIAAIIRVIWNIFGNKQPSEADKQEQVTEQVKNSVIPDVASHAVQYITQELEKVANQLEAQITASFSEEQQAHDQKIQQFQRQLDEDKASFDQLKTGYERGLVQLAALATRLKDAQTIGTTASSTATMMAGDPA